MRIQLVGAGLEENLAVRYILASLERAGHDVVEIPFNDAGDLESVARRVAAARADLVGFSMVFTRRAREFARLATRARDLGFRGHLTAGGHFAAFHAEDLLRDVPAFDSVACGEGEEIACELADRLDALPSVRGLVWRSRDGRVVRNAPAVKPPDLDALPEPARRGFVDEYLGFPIANLLSSRGCTHACSFCSIAAWHRLCGGARFRVRGVEQVADEIAGLYARGVRIFNFHDDNFFLRQREETLCRVRALKRALGRRGVGRIAFAVKSRPDSVDRKLFQYLKSMGLFRVFLGVEAGTAESLRRLGRGQTLDDNERALAVVNALDLHACFNLLLLNPDSTLEDVSRNVAFLRRHPWNPMDFCRTEIYSGTPLEAKLRREGRLLGDYWGYDYRIADPRAEKLFEIVVKAFWERNHGKHSAHVQTMRVDYEYQLLSHFLRGDAHLRRRVKAYVAEVNRNTCEHLDAAVAAVGGGVSPAGLDGFVRDLAEEVRCDNEALWARGEMLLEEIRAAGRRCTRKDDVSWRHAAAAAGVAATLALGGVACEKRTHPWEMTPPPPTEDEQALRDEVARKVLPRLARALDEPEQLEVTLEIDERGNIVRLLTRARGQVDLEAFRDVRVVSSGAAAGTHTFSFSADEVRRVLPPPTHTTEMVPVPVERDE